MARQVIYVLSHGDKWKVKCDHCTKDEIKETQAEAIREAKNHVTAQPAATLSEIRIQGKDGQWRAEWTYGKDPYPPPG